MEKTFICLALKQASTEFAYLTSLIVTHMKCGSNSSILKSPLFAQSYLLSLCVSCPTETSYQVYDLRIVQLSLRFDPTLSSKFR